MSCDAEQGIEESVGCLEIKEVQVPLRILGPLDCPASLQIPTPHPAGAALTPEMPEEAVSITVPEGSKANCTLHLQLGDTSVAVQLPCTATVGDELLIFKKPDGTWRAVRRTTEFAFLVPVGHVAHKEYDVFLSDGTHLYFEVPKECLAGEIVTFRRLEDSSWVAKCVTAVECIRSPPFVDALHGPYVELLKAIAQRGYLQTLPLDQGGTLQVSVPFCGAFQESMFMGNFISDECLTLPGVTAANVFATDISDTWSYDWAVAERWFGEFHPHIKLHTAVKDLSVEPLPEAGLCLAIHPEVTKGGCWFQIIGSIVKSCKGLCVLATFFEHEKETVLNMLDMFKAENTRIDAIENPYYSGRELPRSPDMRYIIFVDRVS